MSYDIMMNIDVKIFLLIIQFVYCNHFYFSNAEPLVGPPVRRVRGNEFPFVVSIGKNLVRDVELNHVCTGSLISRNHVLTSAHCLGNLVLGAFHVSIGSSDLRTAEKYSASWKLTYDEWAQLNNMPISDDDDNDIAIIKLSRSVDNPRIVPATLSLLNSYTATGLPFNIAGWGKGEDGRIPSILRTVRVIAISLIECSEIVSKITGDDFYVDSLYLCTQSNPPSYTTCGDSGGPLFTDNNEIIGIGRGTCSEDNNLENSVNLHLSIDDYRQFIAAVLRT